MGGTGGQKKSNIGKYLIKNGWYMKFTIKNDMFLCLLLKGPMAKAVIDIKLLCTACS